MQYCLWDQASVVPVWTPGASLVGFMKETTRYCYKLNQQDVGLMASDKISKGFPIISLWELIVDYGN